MKARVIGFQDATSTTQPILILQYINTGSDFQTSFLADGENITADVGITHTSSYGIDVASATTFSTNASQRGSAVRVEEGIYFVRGQFIRISAQILYYSQNNVTPSGRFGFA